MRELTKADCGQEVSLDELKQHLLEMLIALGDFCDIKRHKILLIRRNASGRCQT